jgi:hypothetical protein
MSERSKTLIRHFFSRFFDKESISPDGDAHANVVQIVAMLAVPGAILSLFTIPDHMLIRSEYMRMWLRAGDRFVFVSYSMVVMGFVMTFKWDSLFPDRGDYLILTPLPITLREFFVSKVLALCTFLMFFAVAINFFSCIIVPYVYLLRDNRLNVIIPGFFAHAVAVVSGAIFMSLFFAALQGVLINLVTPQMFRRLSTWIQMIAMAVLVTVLLITPWVSTNIRPLAESNSRVLDYIPLFWFLGIYEVLNPEGTLMPASYLWASRAVEAMALVTGLFALSYLVSYRRYSRKILEGIESEVFTQPWHQRARAWALNLTVLRHPFQRASFYFIGRVFGRSAKHRLFIAMYGGIALAVTLSSVVMLQGSRDFVLAVSLNGLMEAPLILSFFIVSGLRATFNIPYELSANWMFQMTSARDATEFLQATRKWILLRGIIPVYCVLFPIELLFFDLKGTMFHLGFGLALAALLVELLFFKFNKVPFTCSYLPAKSHLAFLAGAYLYGFTIYTFTMGDLERWVGESPVRIAVFFGFVCLLLCGFCWYRRSNRDWAPRIVYEDDRDPLVRQLNLT